MGLRVIGAGFGRTGTLSLKHALERLGFAKCHHMEEVAGSREQIEMWQRLANAGDVDWDQLMEGYQASCDWPSCTYWEELSRHYPDAKIVLSVRDPECWYTSCSETIYRGSVLVRRWLAWVPSLGRYSRMVFATVWDGTFEGRFAEREFALRVYHDHVARVKATVPPERLLVFEAKSGWEPLCAFLDVPVPDEPYPHLNDAARIKRMIRIVQGVLIAVPLAALAALAALLL